MRCTVFAKLSDKFHAFSDHHQIFITLLVAAFIFIASWAIEKILEEFIPAKKISYISTVVICLFSLWIVKHLILHVW